MLPKSLVSELSKSLEISFKNNHRLMLVLTGDNAEKSLRYAYLILKKFYDSENISCLYVFHAFYEDGVRRKNLFDEMARNFKRIKIHLLPYHECKKVLGLTFNLAILDLHNNLEPNDVSRIIGVVKGGGLIILITPSFKIWMKVITRFQQNLLTIQYSVEDIRHIFVRRFISKLYSMDGIIIYDIDRMRLLKKSNIKLSLYKKRNIIIPEKKFFPQMIYELALTQDQVNVLRLLEKFYSKVIDRKLVMILTADRGRGKSCAIGIGVVALADRLYKRKGKCRILVTAPEEENVQSFFGLALKTFETLNYRVKVESKDENIIALRSGRISIEYYPPIECLRLNGDILVVDEAASLQVPMLYRIYDKFNKIIFSSTIHGYEGAGRGFSIRFLGMIRKDMNVDLIEYEMKEPIRYASNDPVEKWLFDTFLLDAEPAPLDDKDIEDVNKFNIKYYVPELEKFFLRKEKELREFIGIYVMAHYRNNPNDLGMMMDAPHHIVRMLKLPSNKIVNAVDMAIEGPIPIEIRRKLLSGLKLAGNIIPDRFIKHFKLFYFGDLKGIRIVRIATHPQVMGKGLGSYILKKIEEEAIKNGYDWIGAGFGASKELLNFWIKNKYIPIHISPDRNPVSGEYTVIVIKPLSARAVKYTSYANREFIIKLINSMSSPYYDLMPGIAEILLRKYFVIDDIIVKPNLTLVQRARLISYIFSEMTLETCMDVVKEIVSTYFYDLSKNAPILPIEDRILLIARILQSKNWRTTCKELDLNPLSAIKKVRDIVKKLTEHYYGSIEELKEKTYAMLEKIRF